MRDLLVVVLYAIWVLLAPAWAQTTASDGAALCDIYNQQSAAVKASLTNWCTSSAPYNPCSTTWTGVVCASKGGMIRVVNLTTSSMNLVGTLPTTIGNLGELIWLAVDSNSLNSFLPSQIGLLTNLKFLDLDTNKFTSSLPTTIGNMKALTLFEIGVNSFRGNIPTELALLTNLQWLSLQQNQFTGAVPITIGSIGTLTKLAFQFNSLSSSIPSQLGNLINLLSCELNNNQFTSTVPTNIGSLTALTFLDLSHNSLLLTIPSQIGSLINMLHLDLSNNRFTSAVPTNIGSLAALNWLSLEVNSLSSSIPTQVWSLTNLVELYLASNKFTSTLPTTIGNLGALTALDLQFNSLGSSIPLQLWSLINLQTLSLNNNKFTSTLPTTIGNMGSLTALALQFNSLRGSIPKEIGSLANLKTLGLNSNKFTSGVPSSICSGTTGTFLQSSISLNISSNPSLTCFPSCPSAYKGLIKDASLTYICGSPSAVPTRLPTPKPSTRPTPTPSARPTAVPSAQPSLEPTSPPSPLPSDSPTPMPSSPPTAEPSADPTLEPSALPSAIPSISPTPSPTTEPSPAPSPEPTNEPSSLPSTTPTPLPSPDPTVPPSPAPSSDPTMEPSSLPSTTPTPLPSPLPTFEPSSLPSTTPTPLPSPDPTVPPSPMPSTMPTPAPTSLPTLVPSPIPSSPPTTIPSAAPSVQPTPEPTIEPTSKTTPAPSFEPTAAPSSLPSTKPTPLPSFEPTAAPSSLPSPSPTSMPSTEPSPAPSTRPSPTPTQQPTPIPSTPPTPNPSEVPSPQPTAAPTFDPTFKPSALPSPQPTVMPTSIPSPAPSPGPSSAPSPLPSPAPSPFPSAAPSHEPTVRPSPLPSPLPSPHPSGVPTVRPSPLPSPLPTGQPSGQPTFRPSQPTGKPSGQPSSQPSLQPTARPSRQPSSQPSVQPSLQPTMTTCPRGSYIKGFKCLKCSAGSISVEVDSHNCTQCPAGKFTTQSGLTACEAALPGFFSSGLGSNKMQQCNAGYFGSAAGATACAACPAGKFAGSPGSLECTLCPAMTFNPLKGQPSCTICSGGRISPIGAIDLTQCVSPSSNFVFGLIVLGISVFVAGYYVIGGQYRFVAFIRRQRVVDKQVETYKNFWQKLLNDEIAQREENEKLREKKKIKSFLGQICRWHNTYIIFRKFCLEFGRVLAFAIVGFFVGVLVTVIIFVAFLAALFFQTLILYKQSQSYIALKNTYQETLQLIVDYIFELLGGLPNFTLGPLRLLVNYAIKLFTYLAAFKIDLSGIGVTCTGALAPFQLLTNLVILGSVIIVICSGMQLFRGLVFKTTLSAYNSHFLSQEYRTKILAKKKYLFEYVGFWLWYIWFLLFIGFLQCFYYVVNFLGLFQFILSQVQIRAFGAQHGWHADTPSCNSVVGYENFDFYIARASTIVAYLLILPSLYEIGRVICPYRPDKKSDSLLPLLKSSGEGNNTCGVFGLKKLIANCWSLIRVPITLASLDLWLAYLTKLLLKVLPDEASDKVNDEGKEMVHNTDKSPPKQDSSLKSAAKDLLVVIGETTDTEREEWEEEKDKVYNPSYFELLQLEFLEVLGIKKIDQPESEYWLVRCFDPRKTVIGLFFCLLLFLIPIGHLVTDVGQRHCGIIISNYFQFLLVAVGYWNNDRYDEFDIYYEVKTMGGITAKVDEDADKPKESEGITKLKDDKGIPNQSDESFNKVITIESAHSDCIAAVVAPRAVLLQIIPFMSIFSVLSIATCGSPLFVTHKTAMDERIAKPIIWDAQKKARDLEKNTKYERRLWLTVVRAIAIVFLESRYLQFLFSASSVIFSIFVLVIGVSKGIVLAACCVFIPISIAQALQVVAVVGKAMNCKDILFVFGLFVNDTPQKNMRDRITSILYDRRRYKSNKPLIQLKKSYDELEKMSEGDFKTLVNEKLKSCLKRFCGLIQNKSGTKLMESLAGEIYDIMCKENVANGFNPAFEINSPMSAAVTPHDEEEEEGDQETSRSSSMRSSAIRLGLRTDEVRHSQRPSSVYSAERSSLDQYSQRDGPTLNPIPTIGLRESNRSVHVEPEGGADNQHSNRGPTLLNAFLGPWRSQAAARPSVSVQESEPRLSSVRRASGISSWSGQAEPDVEMSRKSTFSNPMLASRHSLEGTRTAQEEPEAEASVQENARLTRRPSALEQVCRFLSFGMGRAVPRQSVSAQEASGQHEPRPQSRHRSLFHRDSIPMASHGGDADRSPPAPVSSAAGGGSKFAPTRVKIFKPSSAEEMLKNSPGHHHHHHQQHHHHHQPQHHQPQHQESSLPPPPPPPPQMAEAPGRLRIRPDQMPERTPRPPPPPYREEDEEFSL